MGYFEVVLQRCGEGSKIKVAISTKREYERYKMSSYEFVEQYFSCITNLINMMKVYGEDILNNKIVDKILQTLPMKFDHVVTTIIESHDTNTMTIEKLYGSIESHVSRILEKTKKENEEALKSQVNLNNVAETSRSAENRAYGNFNSGGRGNFKGRGRGNYNGRG